MIPEPLLFCFIFRFRFVLRKDKSPNRRCAWERKKRGNMKSDRQQGEQTTCKGDYPLQDTGLIPEQTINRVCPIFCARNRSPTFGVTTQRLRVHRYAACTTSYLRAVRPVLRQVLAAKGGIPCLPNLG